MNQTSTVSDTSLLIMYGQYDSDLAKAMSELWIKSNPNSEKIVINNAGDFANMDNPNEFNEAVYNFYQSIKL